MRTLAVIGFVTFVGLGEWIVDTLQPFFWPLAGVLIGAALFWGAMRLLDARPGRKQRDAKFARRHMVKR